MQQTNFKDWNLDNLFAKPLAQVPAFAFDEAVTSVFPDMIRRSVPGYGNILQLLGVFAQQYAQPHSKVYDLGCSLGAATLALRHKIPDTCQIIAVDNAEAMVKGCQENMAADLSPVPVEVLLDDVQNVPIENASMVVLNFTLQFLPPPNRVNLLKQIFNGLRPNGLLILSEKVLLTSDIQPNLHLHFKSANGYSNLEIHQKRTAIENVLIPDTIETHLNRLQNIGFTQTELWFRCLNFASFMAIK